MKVTTLNFKELSDIIDNAIFDNKAFSIMCYGDLAKELQTYVNELYDIEDLEPIEIKDDEEYCVSSLPAENGYEYMFFIESIYGMDRIKDFDGDSEMMIFIDISQEEVNEYIHTRSIGYYKYIDDSEDDCDGDCDNCCGCNEEFKCDCPECTIEKYVNLLMTDRCENCTREILKMFMGDIIEHIVVENDAN